MIPCVLLALCLGCAGQSPATADENPFALNQGIRQFVDNNIDRGTETLTQLQTLVRTVFEENKLHFTYQPVTRTAIETFDNRGGNCVSFTFLLIAMARYLGMDARFREVDIEPIWSDIGGIPSMDGHADVAVQIGTQVYFVDLFPTLNAVRLAGHTISDQRAIAHFWNNRGAEELGSGRVHDALSYFRKALKSDSTAAFAWANIGVAESLLGDDKEAARAYKNALKIDKGQLIAMSNLASLDEHIGRIDDARLYRDKIKKFNDRNPYYHFELGLKAYEAGHYTESIEQLRAALKLKATDQRFYLAIANDYVQLGALKEARKNVKLAMRLAPDESSRARYSQKLQWLAAHQ